MKNIFKRAASFLTSVAMACTLLVGNFAVAPATKAEAADSTPTITVENVSVDPGSTTAKFGVYLENNLDLGFSSFQATLALPDGYTFKSAYNCLI